MLNKRRGCKRSFAGAGESYLADIGLFSTLCERLRPGASNLPDSRLRFDLILLCICHSGHVISNASRIANDTWNGHLTKYPDLGASPRIVEIETFSVQVRHPGVLADLEF